MPDETPKADVYVLAGPNGAGKSSVIGAGLTEQGLAFFNPDDAAKRILAALPQLTKEQANSFGWQEGQRLLEEAVERGERFAFETTLGGRTVTSRLGSCLDGGGEVHMWFVCLDSAELCLERIRARVDAGGHDIPEADVRRRFDSARENLIRLLPQLTDLRLYDNSAHGNPDKGEEPAPRLILRIAKGTLVELCRPEEVPGWAKPIVMTAAALSGVVDPAPAWSLPPGLPPPGEQSAVRERPTCSRHRA
jgi:predicted ABC-type ATPase